MSENYWNQRYPSIRRPVLARNVVATSQPLAAQAGLEMLRRGGNAMDAVLATAITLTVVEPTSNGIGSDAFTLFNQGDRLLGLNGSGKSPKAWTAEHFSKYESMPFRGWDTVTVPGCVSTWVECSKYGRLPFEELFEPAIQYAHEGFHVSPVTADAWAAAVDIFREREDFMSTFSIDGRAPNPGELFKSPGHAATLELIAETRGEAFYRGELAEKIVAHAKDQGGLLRLDDLSDHQVKWVDPISIDLKNLDLYEIPPNGQGLAALIALGICREFDLGAMDPESADAVHIQLEAMKLAFADLHSHVSDPDTMEVSTDQLLDRTYLKRRAGAIDMKRAGTPETGIPLKGGTVYLCSGDEEGMMVSYIQSNYAGFGSGVVVPGTGISLQNRGANFVLTENHPNQVKGNKRPFHTIIPGMIYQDGKPKSAFGVMGGNMQAQGHLQMILRLHFWGQNPQTALDAPRWMIGGESSLRPEVSLEQGFASSVLEELSKRGHWVTLHPVSAAFGGGQFVWKTDDGYLAASDPRKDGQAVGY
ncbi:MAG: gamma-glutamyltransferase family protein [SAR324 cluster bacterium]|nr:gamma-glutamyltransferase family protein [SAR324 cluster bacterium]